MNNIRWKGNKYEHCFNIIYEVNNEKNNVVKEYNTTYDTLLFEGQYLNGKRNGKGKEYKYPGILIFEGEYFNGKRNGKGKEYIIMVN